MELALDYQLVSQLDLRSPVKQAAFRWWQVSDGTQAGLETLQTLFTQSDAWIEYRFKMQQFIDRLCIGVVLIAGASKLHFCFAQCLQLPHFCVLISGKDSLATALVQQAAYPYLPYEYLFNDTGCELPETYAWLAQVEAQTGWEIERLSFDLEAKIHDWNGFLPNSQARYCTKNGKIKPGERRFKGLYVAMFYGLRADENRIGYVPVGGNLITPLYPLQAHNIDLPGVWSLLKAQNLLPPTFFWQRLYEAVKRRLDDVEWESRLSEWQFKTLFDGRSRANCYFCWAQRQYEFLWLLETHPPLFAKAKAFEKSEFFWMKGYPLTKLESPAEQARIFESRVQSVCSTILGLLQLSLFETTDSELAATSCGLLCGK